MGLKKQPSVETWARPPAPIARSSRLPYGPTPTGTTARLTRSGPSQPTTQGSSEGSTQLYIPSHTKATFQWVRGELLGQGSYGRVYMALNVNTGELMAVKQVDIPRDDHKPAHQDALRFLAFESETLKELDHPNIVQYLGYQDSSEAFSVFLEYVPGGTIGTLIQKYGRFREEVTKSFTKQILEGLDYLHDRGILHRDLKPDNILVEPTGVCKISDFGISKRVEDIHNARGHTRMRGTVQYMAPEVLGENGYEGKIDIWSVGCMIMEMWTGEKPWGGINFMTIMLKLRETQTSPPLPAQLQKELSSEAHNFRNSCFHVNPVQRPSAAELKQHPYLHPTSGWSFSEHEIAHPSRERRVNAGGRRQRDHENDGSTLRPNGRAPEDRDATVLPENIAKARETATLKASDQPIPRGPSPPIVYIKPLARSGSQDHSLSPTETQDQDVATSESSTTSSSRRSGKRKHKYRVVNQVEESSPSFHYTPPPLPPVSQRYSTHLGTSSKYNLDYIPEPVPSSRTRSSSNPHITSTPAPSSSSSGHPSLPYSSSKSSSSSASSLLQSSVGTEDSGTWKRPPIPETLRRGKASPSSSNARHENGSASAGHLPQLQLRTPPPPTVPPPLPPVHTLRFTPSMPSMRMSLRPSSSPKVKHTKSSPAPTQVVDRPFADDIVRHLGDYFPDHDLDQPVVLPTFVDDSVQDFNLSLAEDDDEDDEFIPTRQGHGVGSTNSYNHTSHSSSSGRLSRFGNALNPFGSRLGGRPLSSYRPTVDDSRIAPSGTVLSHSGSTSSNRSRDGQGGLGHVKSIRKIAEEQVSKRQSNPGRAHRQSLWGIQMEELKTLPQLPNSTLQQSQDSRRI